MTRRRALALAGLLLAVTLAALVVAVVTMLPEAARRLAIWRLEALTHRRVTIEGIDVNVFSGHVVVRGVRVAELDGGGMLAEVDRLEGRVHRRSLLRLHVWIEDLAVRGSRVHIVRLGPNRFNISDLLERPATPPSRIAVTIDRLHIAQSAVVLEDRTLRPPRTWASERIVIEGRDISTARGGGSVEAETTLAGAPVSVRIEELRLSPVHLRAHVTVGNVDLALLRLYIPGDAAVLPTGGTLAAGVTLVYDARAGLRLSAGARIGNPALERRGQEGTFLTSPSLTVILNDLALEDRAWSLARAEVDGDVAVVEAALAPPLRYDLRGTRLVVEEVTWPATRPGRIAFAAGLPSGATARVTGTVQAGPPRAELDVRLTGVPLELANRYLRLHGTLAGTADTDAHVVVALGGATKITATGALALTRVSLADPDRPGTPPLAVDRVDATGIEYEWPARATLAVLDLRHPSAMLERGASGDLSLRALLRRSPAPDAGPSAGARADGPPALDVTVGELRVEDGAVALSDGTLTPARRYDVTGVSLDARDASWPARGPVQIALGATLPGAGRLDLDGALALDRRTADLRVALKNGDLALAQPYLPFAGRVHGRVDAGVSVSAQLGPPRVSVRGTVAVTGATVTDGDRPLLTLERVELDGVDLAWPRRLEIQLIHVRRPWAAIERDARGQLSLRAIFSAAPGAGGPRAGAPSPTAAPGGGGARARPPMEIAVREALFEDGSTTIVDTSVEPAARFHVEDSRLHVWNLTWPVKTPAQVELTTGMPRGGRLQASGTFQVDPGRVDLRVALSGVNLAPAQPYLPVDARVTGKLDGEAQLVATFDPLELEARGRATLTDLGLGDGDRSLFTAGGALVEDARVSWPGGVRIASVAVDRPWVLIERGPDGRFPLLALLTPHAPGGARPRAKNRPPSSARPRWEIGTLSLTDGFGRYVDYGTTPDFAEELSALQLTAKGIDTAPGARTRLALRATLGPASPLAVDAELNLTGPRFFDVSVSVADYAAPRANPYLELWTGWHARQGLLTTTLHYRVDGDELRASNDIGLKGLELAEAAKTHEVRRRIGLPLNTLVSLLKDRHGDIHVSIPVHGLLSSPEFELREAIWGAARNLAIRLVALPFSLIGKLFFSEDSRIEAVGFDPVPFEPGTAVLNPAAAEQLGRLAAFLGETPAVRLRLRPVLTVADTEILKREAVRERLRTATKDRSPAAMQAAAARAFARRYPTRPLPPSTEEIVAVLAGASRVPDAATRALATRRVTAVLGRLTAAGIDAARLAVPERPPVVESEGTGRIEFELAP